MSFFFFESMTWYTVQYIQYRTTLWILNLLANNIHSKNWKLHQCTDCRIDRYSLVSDKYVCQKSLFFAFFVF